MPYLEILWRIGVIVIVPCLLVGSVLLWARHHWKHTKPQSESFGDWVKKQADFHDSNKFIADHDRLFIDKTIQEMRRRNHE